jgi:hypothetical protein
VHAIDVKGAVQEPFFHEDDLRAVETALKAIADDQVTARRKAAILKELLSQHTWVACAEKAAGVFGWQVQRGIAPPVPPVQHGLSPSAPTAESSPLQLPTPRWQLGGGVSESYLLRAEEELVPFDPAVL